MALDACHRAVSPGQRELRAVVLESTAPMHGRFLVALSAIGGEPCGGMVWRRASVVVVPVTTIAVNGNSRELFSSGVRVARLAVCHGMSSEQREPGRLVFLHHVGDSPGLCGVTSQAVGSQLALVDIGVARQAIGGSLLECQSFVAAHTAKIGVLPGEREAGRLVRERRVFGHLP